MTILALSEKVVFTILALLYTLVATIAVPRVVSRIVERIATLAFWTRDWLMLLALIVLLVMFEILIFDEIIVLFTIVEWIIVEFNTVDGSIKES